MMEFASVGHVREALESAGYICSKTMDILNKKTTLIVIGDGRSNYTDPEVPILEAMRGRSRRLVWLNPETEQFWATGDSEMRALAAVCDTVRPCQNLKQLTDFITSLVL